MAILTTSAACFGMPAHETSLVLSSSRDRRTSPQLAAIEKPRAHEILEDCRDQIIADPEKVSRNSFLKNN